MADFPSLPLWTDAYLADTQDLSAEEHGVYLLLLISAWRSPDCTLPDDDQRLARMARVGTKKWRRLRPVMERFFKVENGCLWQKRLMEERERVENQRNQRQEAINARWGKKEAENSFLCDADRNATSDTNGRHIVTGKSLQNLNSGSTGEQTPEIRANIHPSPSPSPSPYTTSPPPVTATAGAGAGAAAGFEGLADVCQRIQRIVNAGHPLPDVARYVERWRENGLDVERDVIWTIQQVMDRRTAKGQGPPSHPRYFEAAVFRAYNDRTAAPPDQQAKPPDGSGMASGDGMTRGSWRKLVDVYERTGEWHGAGPPPGRNGCRVPSDILAEYQLDQNPKRASG
jgi:uncharacterized protein YdaU (DUF1376 family)